MPQADLKTHAPSSGAVLYFDTTAVYALATDRGNVASARDQNRAHEIRAFVARVQGIALRTTILTMQEVASIAQRLMRQQRANAAGYARWQEFWAKDRTAAVQADLVVSANTLQLLEWALQELDALGIALERPCIIASERISAARRLQRQHADLLRACPSLDSMDALHILKGIEIGATDFVSFDGGWIAVPGITVYAL